MTRKSRTARSHINNYIFGCGMLVARGGSPTIVLYYHTDALGSVRLKTDPNKIVVFSDNYQPFGQDNGTPTGSETYRFTGKPVSAQRQVCTTTITAGMTLA